MSISFTQIIGLLKANALGMVVALVLGPLAVWLAIRMKLVDIPGSAAHKSHLLPTPMAGGIVLTLSLILFIPVFHLWQKPVSAILTAAIIIFIFGLLDDAKRLSPPQKLIGQVLGSILLIALGVSVHIFEGFSFPFLSEKMITVLDWGVTVFWIVGITNAFNFVDSMDGLAVGIAGIAFAFLMGMALVAQQIFLANFSALCLGICIGMYFFNVSPARFFLGDAGAQTLGFILAAVAIVYTPQNLPQGSSWFVPIMVLGIPIFDTTLVVISRLRRHQPIYLADQTHTFHRLVALGVNPRRAVVTIHLGSLALCLLAFIALSLTPWMANLIFGVVLCAGFVALFFLGRGTPNLEADSQNE
jgi:UDP-GlcNAc:undecaprenyl-phosphate/decaprenyl-phosphate GlcNAc-1-phosphate transferase